jgi:heptaprenyl diphosphate synthase
MSGKEFFENNISAKALFIAGLLMMPALLFNPSTELRILQFLFFWLLIWFSGKKINVLLTILVIVFIVAFNLIIPYGKVLFSVGGFKITSGALTAGIHRAVTFEALVMLSNFCIRKDIKLPGAFGKLLSDSFYIFSVMMNRKYRITGKNFIVEIDNMMMELGAEELPEYNGEKQKTKPAGIAILVVIVILSWLPFVKTIFAI